MKEDTGAAALCPCRCFLPPRNPFEGALRVADRSWRSAAVPLLSLVLCRLSSLLASVCNVMLQGSCVKAWPRGAHQQDGYCGLTASEGRMAYQAGLGAGGRGRGVGWRAAHGAAIAWSQGFCPLNASHDTLACQFTNGPVGLCFHAHTCSV